MDRRRALTLLELLVVVAIIAVLVAILVPAIQQVRSAALATQCANRQKQLALAAHQYAGDHGGQLPVYNSFRSRPIPDPWDPASIPSYPMPLAPSERAAPFVQLLVYLDQGAAFRRFATQGSTGSPMRALVCPLDPTLGDKQYADELTSYALNAQVFTRETRLESGFPDGTSATMLLAEHYARCGDIVFFYVWGGSGAMSSFEMTTFAGPWPVGSPVTRGNPPVSSGRSLPADATFQHRPSLTGCPPPPPGPNEPQPAGDRPSPSCCNSSMAQTGHPGGMSVAMADGSVRVVRAGVAPPAYWAATTPAGGEVAPLD